MMSSLVNARPAPAVRQCAILKPIDGSAIPAPIALNRPVCVVGDRSRVHLVLPSPLVSRSHALLIDDADGLYVRDLCSSNGVLVNDGRIRETLLQDGDCLRMGPFAFRCRISRPIPDDSHEPVMAEIRGDDFIPVPLNARRTTLIGSRGGCDVRVRGVGVSPVHAVVFRRRGRWFIRDLSSEGGTRIFGRLIREAELLGGEQIRVGTAAIWYIRPDQEKNASAQAPAADAVTAAEALDAILLDDVQPIEIGPEESGFSPLPATGENWTRSEGFDAAQVTADDLGLDMPVQETALASASNLQSADPEQTLMDASRSVLTLADLIDTPMTSDDLGLDDEVTAIEPGDAGEIADRDAMSPPARVPPERAIGDNSRSPRSRPNARPTPIDAGSVFDHEMIGNPEESGALPEFSALLGIDSALADMGLGDDTPPRRRPAVDAVTMSAAMEASPAAESPTTVPDSPEPIVLRELTFAPLVAGWAKCPGCGTAFPLHSAIS